MGKPRIVAVIPAYNEGSSIASVVLETSRHVDGVILCDDGSIDDTAEIARRMGAKVIQNPRNMGKGAAVKRCLVEALGEDPGIVVMIDADGQHSPRDIPRLVEPIASGQAELVIGSRFLEGSVTDAPAYRRLGLGIIDGVFGKVLGGGITDTQSGFRAFHSSLIELMLGIESDGYGFETEQNYKALSRGVRIKEVPTTVRYVGVLRASKKNPLLQGVEVLGTIARLVVEERSFRYMGAPGVALLLMGALMVLLLTRYDEVSFFNIPLATITTVSLASGIVLVLGFLVFPGFNKLGSGTRHT